LEASQGNVWKSGKFWGSYGSFTQTISLRKLRKATNILIYVLVHLQRFILQPVKESSQTL